MANQKFQITALLSLFCATHGNFVPAASPSGPCAVAVGRCCPSQLFGYTPTRWQRWPGSQPSEPAGTATPRNDPPPKGDELRSRDVREDKKGGATNEPATTAPEAGERSETSPDFPPTSDLPEPPAGFGTENELNIAPEPDTGFPPSGDSDRSETPSGVGLPPLDPPSSPGPNIDNLFDTSPGVEPPPSDGGFDPFGMGSRPPAGPAQETYITGTAPLVRRDAIRLATATEPIAARDNPLRLRTDYAASRAGVRSVIAERPVSFSPPVTADVPIAPKPAPRRERENPLRSRS